MVKLNVSHGRWSLWVLGGGGQAAPLKQMADKKKGSTLKWTQVFKKARNKKQLLKSYITHGNMKHIH